MRIKNGYRILFILLVVMANIGCDQVSKSIVRENLDYHDSIRFFDDHFMVTKVENTGAFLSAGDSLPPVMKTLVLSLVPALTLVALLVWLFLQRGMNAGMLFGLSCVVGGGIGNIFDRFAYGSVTDFLYINFGFFQTGVFNLADVSITGGVVYLLVNQWINNKNRLISA